MCDYRKTFNCIKTNSKRCNKQQAKYSKNDLKHTGRYMYGVLHECIFAYNFDYLTLSANTLGSIICLGCSCGDNFPVQAEDLFELDF